MKVNSVEYWDEKFEKTWEKNNGEGQTSFFCKKFLQNIPNWLKDEINKNKYSIIDLGCAEGEAVNILSKEFVNSDISGMDFSLTAINKAKSKYPTNKFEQGDLFEKLNINQDIIYCSNTLEHFEDPSLILKNIFSTDAKYVFLMMPIYDNPNSAENGEHQYFFDYKDFKVKENDYNLQYIKVFDSKEDEKEYWIGSQVILIYSKEPSIKFEDTIINDLDHYLNYQICQSAKVLCLNNITEKELLKDKIELAKKESLDWKEKYENLYQYSCNRDAELLSIKNSRGFMFFNKFLKKPMNIVYKFIMKIYRIFRALFTLNFKEFIKEIGTPFIRINRKINQITSKKKMFKEINESIQNKRVIILPPTLDWHMPLFQRPQQLALSYSKKEDTVVLYMTKNIQYDNIAVAERVSNSLWIINESLLSDMNLEGGNTKILSLSWTPNKFYCDIIKPDKLIYEYIDELEIFHMYGPEMEKDHQELLNKADVTVCTATKLYNQVKDKAQNPIVSTNAGDYEFFSKTNEAEINALIKDKIKGYKCVLGYYGAVAKWFDYDLVKKVAERRKDWLWVIVGINYDGTLDKSGLLDIDNILYIPPQPYKLLPTFLKAFDIATIPFLINEITLSTSPVKLFEYMAAGKPILASKMPECLKYRSVFTYENHNDFIEYVEKIQNLKQEDEYWNIIDDDAKSNTWDAKTDEILEALH